MHRLENRSESALLNYLIQFEDEKESPIKLEINSFGEFLKTVNDTNYSWARLEHHKCSCCPLKHVDCSHCPAALSLASLLDRFIEHQSVEKVSIIATDRIGRRTDWSDSLQEALCILMRIAIFGSGCPITASLQPLLADLNPLATHNELIRHLTLKFLLLYNGDEISAQNMVRNWIEKMSDIDSHMAERIRSEFTGDAILNSLIVMDADLKRTELSFSDICHEMRDELDSMTHSLSRRIGELRAFTRAFEEARSQRQKTVIEYIETKAVIRNAKGIHCRPGTIIVKSIAGYDGDISISTEKGSADARSLLSLLILELKQGDQVTIHVHGPHAKKTSQQLANLLETHFDFDDNPHGSTKQNPASKPNENLKKNASEQHTVSSGSADT